MPINQLVGNSLLDKDITYFTWDMLNLSPMDNMTFEDEVKMGANPRGINMKAMTVGRPKDILI